MTDLQKLYKGNYEEWLEELFKIVLNNPQDHPEAINAKRMIIGICLTSQYELEELLNNKLSDHLKEKLAKPYLELMSWN